MRKLGILSLLLSLIVTAGCSCSDTDDPIGLPTAPPTPPPIPIPTPAFTKERNFTLVFVVHNDPGNNGQSSRFFDLTRSMAGTWGNDYTETLYVLTAPGKPTLLRREIDNKSNVYIDIWRPDRNLRYEWKLGDKENREGVITAHPYSDPDPLEEACHLGLAGDWTQNSPDAPLNGVMCHSDLLTQADQGTFMIFVDVKTGQPKHFQSRDGGVLCTIMSFTVGPPSADLYEPLPGVYVDKLDK